MLRQSTHGPRPWLNRQVARALAMLVVGLAALGPGLLNSAADGAGSDPQAPAKATTDPHGDPLPAGALARLGTTRLRHGADVTFVTFGPDGKTLITAGLDDTVRVWDLAERKEVRRFARPRPEAPKPPRKGDKPVPDEKDAA